MIQSADAVQTGMEVYTRDGAQMGCVSMVWPHVPTRASEPLAPRETMDTATDTGYFRVDRGGILGVGASQWFVPFREIAEIVPGERIMLACSEAECEEHYSQRPWFADRDLT